MNVIECISTRRSGRTYTEEKIPQDVISELIVLGTKAATGSNQQPWGFVVLQDQQEIDQLSEKIKKDLLDKIDDFPHLKQYENLMTNPKYHVFNHSSCVLIIYGNTDSSYYEKDCTLAAANIMLAAHSMGIGTCWIGGSEYMLNTKEFKEKYHIPLNYDLVCPMSMGYQEKKLNPPVRKEPVIFHMD